MILPDDATPKPDGIFGKDRRVGVGVFGLVQWETESSDRTRKMALRFNWWVCWSLPTSLEPSSMDAGEARRLRKASGIHLKPRSGAFLLARAGGGLLGCGTAAENRSRT